MKELAPKHSLHLISTTDGLSDISEDIYRILSISQRYYPNIFKWYHNKFLKEILQGTRSIVAYYIANDIAGVSLLKKSITENKICTIYVWENSRDNGIGKTLFQKSFEVLNDSKPVITIPERRMDEFQKIINEI